MRRFISSPGPIEGLYRGSFTPVGLFYNIQKIQGTDEAIFEPGGF